MALNDMGFVANNTIAGLGLNTFGFLWPCDGIWSSSEMPITTVWTGISLAINNVEVCVD